jgi:hypothetical protein
MRAHSYLFATLLGLAGLALAGAGCTLEDSSHGGAWDGAGQVVRQPVFLQPLFVLDGLDELPRGIRLDELHLGVGAIFLDLLDSQDGIAFANRTPFRLHFFIKEGRVTAAAPPMTLPQGGRYQISVQIEPQRSLTRAEHPNGLTSLEVPDDEASLVVGGTISEASFTDPRDGGEAEPAPLPWYPVELEEVDQLRRTTERLEFSFTSRRTVRFILDEVELEGGSPTELLMQLQVGSWVEETVSPALRRALGERAGGERPADPLEGVDLDLDGRLGSGDGMDGLIGGMEIEVRQR